MCKTIRDLQRQLQKRAEECEPGQGDGEKLKKSMTAPSSLAEFILMAKRRCLAKDIPTSSSELLAFSATLRPNSSWPMPHVRTSLCIEQLGEQHKMQYRGIKHHVGSRAAHFHPTSPGRRTSSETTRSSSSCTSVPKAAMHTYRSFTSRPMHRQAKSGAPEWRPWPMHARRLEAKHKVQSLGACWVAGPRNSRQGKDIQKARLSEPWWGLEGKTKPGSLVPKLSPLRPSLVPIGEATSASSSTMLSPCELQATEEKRPHRERPRKCGGQQIKRKSWWNSHGRYKNIRSPSIRGDGI